MFPKTQHDDQLVQTLEQASREWRSYGDAASSAGEGKPKLHLAHSEYADAGVIPPYLRGHWGRIFYHDLKEILR